MKRERCITTIMCDKINFQTVQLVVPIDNVGTLSKMYALSILFDCCWSSASLAERLLHVVVQLLICDVNCQHFAVFSPLEEMVVMQGLQRQTHEFPCRPAIVDPGLPRKLYTLSVHFLLKVARRNPRRAPSNTSPGIIICVQSCCLSLDSF